MPRDTNHTAITHEPSPIITYIAQHTAPGDIASHMKLGINLEAHMQREPHRAAALQCAANICAAYVEALAAMYYGPRSL